MAGDIFPVHVTSKTDQSFLRSLTLSYVTLPVLAHRALEMQAGKLVPPSPVLLLVLHAAIPDTSAAGAAL